ncbi:divalent metal cation transporter [Mucilaginibacter rubeus]|uniref:Divalent metal cation transporter n=1 Tax=Mucilaginibacter rubeus TaxID=2027860 RepID=A0AAE6JDE9_9SPHI|nr:MULTISPECIES: Nramp family divalent metal transporter [Mucilaginibacter]QEM03669.1 divalent metal cation transporter [Mucilaginibacter rubeus]QEM16280.1 divalent metal cation transporter [Mucilaginibacter gossypii]QTE40958.1 Nramp family divalent metal transporter [Mucilaginibacter rubeus]QTE47561.1 Nramp family divalent metal transporter [Mucilaginibacter rubeus]QTE58953.1 Nramp family divalent metal transporter [Mucilaginibacter rubeus]
MFKKIRKFFGALGPGIVTGASDDDPSGIATYSQAGAKYGLTTLWTVVITFPLMAAIQEMCARIGLITSSGLTTTLKAHYGKPVLYLMVIFSVPAIILNIGADIAAMGAVANLLVPSVPAIYFSILFTGLLLFFIVYLPYQKFVAVLKYLCLTLLLYIAVPFFTKPDWWQVLKQTIIPTFRWDKDFIGVLVAILGTTISPYLFFWQTAMEAEDVKTVKRQLIVNKRRLTLSDAHPDNGVKRERKLLGLLIQKMSIDVNLGMFLSNLIMFFTILATGTALYSHGVRNIDTVEQAAKALAPVAGRLSYLLFAVGIIGTGFLAIPVLSGSLSYIVTETFGLKGSLDKKFHQAKAFYVILIISVLLGLGINYFGINPVDALLYTAILYGVTCPVIIGIVMHIANNKNIMGEYTNKTLSNILGTLCLLVMTVGAFFLIYLEFFSK